VTELLAFLARVFHAPGPQLGAVARASLDGLPRSDQLSGGSPNRHPFFVSGSDCLASLSTSGEKVFSRTKVKREKTSND